MKILFTDDNTQWSRYGYQIAKQMFPDAIIRRKSLKECLEEDRYWDVILYKNTDITTKLALKDDPRYVPYEVGQEQWKNNTEILKQRCGLLIDKCEFGRKHLPLIIPEINPKFKGKHVTSPNCTTIQVAIPLYYIDKQYQIVDAFVSSYQSWSGCDPQDPRPKHTNIEYIEDEDEKLYNEMHKIFDVGFSLHTHCIRVPTKHCHGTAISLITAHAIKELPNIPGVKFEYADNETAREKPDIYLHNVRKTDIGVNFFCMTDNTYKGAAYNQLQIAQCYLKNLRKDL